MKIVILDGQAINPGDLHWDDLASLGDLTVYQTTNQDQILDHIGNAEAVFFSKIHITEEILRAKPNIRFLGITATGTDNLDIAAAKKRGIACCNVPAYSTDAVAQHAIALMLELSNHVGHHSKEIRQGLWNENRGFCYWSKPLILLSGKSLGVVGYGNIGKKVASIAGALGMTIHIYSESPQKALSSDFVTLHIPSTPTTENFINKKTISTMKDGAFLINTARGKLINEEDLAKALSSGKIAGFAADVLRDEPPKGDNPLICREDVILTPHNSWTPAQVRNIVCTTCGANLKSWLEGNSLNRID